MKNIETHVFGEGAMLNDLLDNIHDLIHIVGLDSNIVYVNKAWEQTLGYERNEIQGVSIYSFVDFSDRDRFIQYRENIINGNVTEQQIVVCLVRNGGDKVFVEGRVSLKTIDNKPLYTKGIFRDITERIKNETNIKLVHQALIEREKNLQQLLFYAPDAIVVIDSNSIVKYWNPKAESIFGWASAEVLEKSLTELIIPEQYRSAHTAGMKRYLSTGEARVLNKTIDITAIHRNGTEFYVSLTIAEAYLNGKTSFIGFLRDINQQKRNALELAEKKTQLELLNRDLEQFAHVTGHDMKEPIRKIIIFADLLHLESRSDFSIKSHNYLTKIQSAAKRLMKMAEGVLAYSALHGEEPVMKKVNLNLTIKEIETDLELIIREKGATITCNDLPTIEGAPFLLYQLFYNLIHNALKFSKPDAKPFIRITASTVESAQIGHRSVASTTAYFEIVVEDNGIGFAPEHAENIFKTFTRLHNNQRYEGAGVGLSLCKIIVLKHKGVITALGTPGVGATFRILLPENQN